MPQSPLDILTDLNPAQREAVETIEGPVLILAGPGSGKTRVITHRIAYLMKVCGISPHRIMAVTFTNKAAREMQERLQRLLGRSAEPPTMGTFHAICARILRQDGSAIGLDPHYTIFDDDDQQRVIKQSLQELGIDPKQYAPKAIQSAIVHAKSQLLTPDDFAGTTGSYFEEIVSRVYAHYQKHLDQSQTVDFEDLLMKTVLLFERYPEILSRYQNRYLHLMVDEFQDTSITQYRLIRQMGDKQKNICVVGDPDQSIYSWRYADIRNILSFERDYPNARVVVLDQNYRSTQNILQVASSIISANVQRKPKLLRTENEQGALTEVVQTYNEGEEAQYVVSEIDRLKREEGVASLDCAVMFRVNAQSRALEEAFMRHGIPYKLVGGLRFYQRREIKDVIAYLKFIHNPRDSVSLSRIINTPGRGIGQRTVNELNAWASANESGIYGAMEQLAAGNGPSLATRTGLAVTSFYEILNQLIEKSRQLPLSGLLDEVLDCTGYKDYILAEEEGKERWENILELRTVAREYDWLETEEALSAFLEKVSLVMAEDETEEKPDAATLTTLHQAKGLEFPVVFIVGMEEGLLPHRRSIEDGEIEEERRLCYVGVTRAKSRVYLLYTFRRSLFGMSAVSEPSRFLHEVPRHLINSITLREAEPEEIECTPVTSLFSHRAGPRQVQPAPERTSTIQLGVGDYVRHSTFGEGIVVACAPFGNDQQATIEFAQAGVKKLLLSLAPLEKIEKNAR